MGKPGMKIKVTIEKDEILANNQTLLNRVSQLHKPGEALMLTKILQAGLTYGQAKTLARLAQAYASHGYVNIPHDIREEDVKAIGDRWLKLMDDLERKGKRYPILTSQLTEEQADKITRGLGRVPSPVSFSTEPPQSYAIKKEKPPSGTYVMKYVPEQGGWRGEFREAVPKVRPGEEGRVSSARRFRYTLRIAEYAYRIETTRQLSEGEMRSPARVQLALIAQSDPNAKITAYKKKQEKYVSVRGFNIANLAFTIDVMQRVHGTDPTAKLKLARK